MYVTFSSRSRNKRLTSRSLRKENENAYDENALNGMLSIFDVQNLQE